MEKEICIECKKTRAERKPYDTQENTRGAWKRLVHAECKQTRRALNPQSSRKTAQIMEKENTHEVSKMGNSIINVRYTLNLHFKRLENDN